MLHDVKLTIILQLRSLESREFSSATSQSTKEVQTPVKKNLLTKTIVIANTCCIRKHSVENVNFFPNIMKPLNQK